MLWIWNLVRKKVMNAKIPIESIEAIIREVDFDQDGFVSVSEIISGVKKLMV